MLQLSKNILRHCCQSLKCVSVQPQCKHLHQTPVCGDKWNIMGAVCLERFPVVTQQMTEQEKIYSTLLSELELQHSCLSDHELRHREDIELIERRKNDDHLESEAESIRQMAQELEDVWEAELEQFTPADRLTEADRTNDLKTHHRKLDRKLILVVKQELGNSSQWMLPMALHKSGESLRQTAERTLSSLCGGDIKALFMGNAPCGFYQYKYPSEQTTVNGYTGAKIFFYKAQLQSGNVQPSKDGGVLDYMWLVRDDLKHYLTVSYQKQIRKFILEL